GQEYLPMPRIVVPIALMFLMAIPAWAQKHDTTTATGLDISNDDALYGELARLGLDSLLDRAFEVNNVSPEKREGVRAVIAMRQLTEGENKLTASQRADLLKRIVAGVRAGLAQTNDAIELMKQAN